MFSDDILKIMYAPLHYIHYSYLGKLKCNKVLSDGLINFWIIKHYQLSELPEGVGFHDRDDIEFLLVKNWQLLPNIALLIGCYLDRTYLRKGIVDSLDLNCYIFISLPLQYQVKYVEVSHADDVIAVGVSFLLELGSNLPLALRQRLIMMFPEGITLPKLCAFKSPDNINLLKMAIVYAKNKF
ncbi:oxidoreductase [Escherichia coli]|nr:oxidoreductase [Escherichia coli]